MSTPRINASQFVQYVNQTVRVVGRIHSLDPSGAMQLATSDNKLINAFSESLAQGEGAYDGTIYTAGSIVEIVGQIGQDGTLQEIVCISLGSNFDLDLYDKLIGLIHGKARPLFL